MSEDESPEVADEAFFESLVAETLAREGPVDDTIFTHAFVPAPGIPAAALSTG